MAPIGEGASYKGDRPSKQGVPSPSQDGAGTNRWLCESLYAQETPTRRQGSMLRWAVIFLIIAIIAAIFGFGGIAATAAGLAKILFFIFLVIFVICLVMGLMAGRGVP
jgi:uncharacterized membrane protein YtjA (UPF0391 family)